MMKTYTPFCPPQDEFELQLVVHEKFQQEEEIFFAGDPEMDYYEKTISFDLKFYTACFAGYVLHTNCMQNLIYFRNLIK